jgi:predicted nucleic acid-binding protein
MRAAFDTNILVDYLNGVPDAKAELARFDDRVISVVTWMEVLVGAAPDEEASIRVFLGGFEVAPIDADVANEAVRLRRERRLRLPDAGHCAHARGPPGHAQHKGLSGRGRRGARTVPTQGRHGSVATPAFGACQRKGPLASSGPFANHR